MTSSVAPGPRAESRRTPRENAFLLAAATTVIASSWLLGGKYLWAQWILLALCGATFVTGTSVALAGRGRAATGSGPWTGWWVSGAAAAAFVTIVIIQSVNIAYVPQFEITTCVNTPVPHVTWLPSSIGGPFNGAINGFIDTENAARYVLIYGAVLLGTFGIALGAQSQASRRTLILVLAVHGIVSAFVCVAHQASGSTKVLWIQQDTQSFLGAPFFPYKNQNAAYQTLLTGWILGWWTWLTVRRPTLSPLYGLIVCVAAGVGLASIRSRAGLLFAGILCAAWLIGQRRILVRICATRRAAAAVIALGLFAAAGATLWQTGAIGTIRRLGEEQDLIRTGIHGGTFRMLNHQIALEMFKDRPWLGWGAGSFLYNYAGYYPRVPELALNRPNSSYYLLGQHADGDWYEFLSEFGALGTALFAIAWIPHLALWVRRRIWRDAGLMLPAIGVVLVLGHGLVDRAFRNVSLLLLLGISTVLVTRLVLARTRGQSDGRLMTRAAEPPRR
jgi:O-antigen ligase